MSITRRTVLMAGSAGALVGPRFALAQAKPDIKLPRTLVWTAYDVGSSGHAQAVGIGSILKNSLGVNLRVLPGKNDVSRLAPLREGTAQFTATDSDNVCAQEAVFTFGEKESGPQPVRLMLQAFADGAAVALATAADANIKTLKEVKGNRVAWVRGAPALNQAVTCMLAFANLTWDDVIKVKFGGHGQAIDGLVNNEVDALNNATFSALHQKVAASPRGIYFPPVPHNDVEGCKRLQAAASGGALVRQANCHRRRRHQESRPGDGPGGLPGAGLLRPHRRPDGPQHDQGHACLPRRLQGQRAGRHWLGHVAAKTQQVCALTPERGALLQGDRRLAGQPGCGAGRHAGAAEGADRQLGGLQQAPAVEQGRLPRGLDQGARCRAQDRRYGSGLRHLVIAAPLMRSSCLPARRAGRSAARPDPCLGPATARA